MSLVVVGLSHHTSSVELREKLAFATADIPRALLDLHRRFDGAGAVILSTCNRVELYVHHALPAADLHAHLRAFLSEWHNVPEQEIADALYEHEGEHAVAHLFRVASSLDSLVPGEAQILGQVHDAYFAAQTAQTTDKIINNLFQKAFTVAKNVRTVSDISSGKVSISSVAVDLAASIFVDLADKTVMVVGSGEMGELTLKSLLDRGVREVLLLNRSIEKAQALAATYSGQPLTFEKLPDNLHRADIVISSTTAPHYILQPEDFHRAIKQRGQRPMFVIDIAVPRDIHPGAGELDDVYVYDIDDLKRVVDTNMESRRREIDRCMTLVDRDVTRFAHWMQGIAAEPTIVSMAEELHSIRRRELEKTLAALPDLSDKQQREVRYLTERIVASILQRPMTQIKHEINHHDPGTVLHLVKRLFGLEEGPRTTSDSKGSQPIP